MILILLGYLFFGTIIFMFGWTFFLLVRIWNVDFYIPKNSFFPFFWVGYGFLIVFLEINSIWLSTNSFITWLILLLVPIYLYLNKSFICKHYKYKSAKDFIITLIPYVFIIGYIGYLIKSKSF